MGICTAQKRRCGVMGREISLVQSFFHQVGGFVNQAHEARATIGLSPRENPICPYTIHLLCGISP